jgi:hypothetical protein
MSLKEIGWEGVDWIYLGKVDGNLVPLFVEVLRNVIQN